MTCQAARQAGKQTSSMLAQGLETSETGHPPNLAQFAYCLARASSIPLSTFLTFSLYLSLVKIYSSSDDVMYLTNDDASHNTQ